MLFFLKLVLVPFVILVLTAISKKSGSAVGGMFAGLPIISGPILLFLSLQHGPSFGQKASETMILGVAGVAIYAVVYSISARRFHWFVSLFLASLFFYLSTLLFVQIPISGMERFFFTVIIILICFKCIPDLKETIKVQPIRFEVFYRIIVGVCLLFTVTYFSNSVGAQYSGVISSFPVTAAIIPTFIHAVQGKEGAIIFLKNLAFSLFSMCIFFTYLSYELVSQGIALSFSLGLIIAMTVQSSFWRLRTHKKL